MEASHLNVVISAVKSDEGSHVIVRVYEASGRATSDVKVKFHVKLAAASEVNLMQDELQKVSVQNNTLHFDLAPFEIKTFKLKAAVPARQS